LMNLSVFYGCRSEQFVAQRVQIDTLITAEIGLARTRRKD
jgi:hypothetical protein